MADFLLEIGMEEVPARMVAGAEAELKRRVLALLEREHLVQEDGSAKSFSTPRRLAVFISNVADRQEDTREELTGPSVKVAYKDGVPTPAALAFAKKAGVEVEALKVVTTPKGEYLAASILKHGRRASEVLSEELPREIAAIYWAKNMYWRPGKPERFVRPIRWMLALLGEQIVPFEFGGKTAGKVTYGHRILFGEDGIAVKSLTDYESALLDANVIADVEVRRQKIRKALDHVTRTVPGARWREDHGLIDTLTHLTEWASDRSVVLGNFESEYLVLPEEVLVTVMRDHQKYFALEDESGKLMPHFLAVLELAELAVSRASQVDAVALDEAALLAKTDLTTELVKEFTELQGVIGGLYAQAQGISAAAADAIYDQYLPASMEDSVPRTVEGSLLAIADRADTIAGMFGLGMEPTGSKDPFALRRAARTAATTS
jgi:glycyl-tRNA synthetase beta chain